MQLHLKHNLQFNDLYQVEGLEKLDMIWLEYLNEHSPALHANLLTYRQNPAIAAKEESEFIISLAPYLEDFIANFFNIDNEVNKLAQEHDKLAPLYKCKRLFVQRQAAKAYNEETKSKLIPAIDLLKATDANFDEELNFAANVLKWEAENNITLLEVAKVYAAWAVNDPEGQAKYAKGILFKLPRKLDMQNLAELSKLAEGHYTGNTIHLRNGFSHTDNTSDITKALDQANYCIHCHKQGKDSCSKGFKEKDSNKFRINEQKVPLAGCPLEEKISEMNFLKSQGSIIGAFAVVLIDNPMAAATGYRICNDCMKACIYQKQEPVDIPFVETNVLNGVLDLPWGFEIYIAC